MRSGGVVMVVALAVLGACADSGAEGASEGDAAQVPSDVGASEVEVQPADAADVCEPDCEGRECGPDGCDGTCGACFGCDGPGTGICGEGFECITPCCLQCEGRECGPDGCGGTCGACDDGTYCGPEAACVECVNDDHCTEDAYCDPESRACKALECKSCEGSYPGCVQIDGTVFCVPCASDADCTAGGTCDVETFTCEAE